MHRQSLLPCFLVGTAPGGTRTLEARKAAVGGAGLIEVSPARRARGENALWARKADGNITAGLGEPWAFTTGERVAFASEVQG